MSKKFQKEGNHKIFLGGTCAETTWRELVIPFLVFDYYNPQKEKWTEAQYQIEEYEKDVACDIHYYVLTSEMKGIYSIAEIMDSVHQSDKLTIVQIVPTGFNKGMMNSLTALQRLIEKRGGIVCIDNDLQKGIAALNKIILS